MARSVPSAAWLGRVALLRLPLRGAKGLEQKTGLTIGRSESMQSRRQSKQPFSPRGVRVPVPQGPPSELPGVSPVSSPRALTSI